MTLKILTFSLLLISSIFYSNDLSHSQTITQIDPIQIPYRPNIKPIQISEKSQYRSQLIEEVDKYLNRFNCRLDGSVVVDACEKYNIDPCFVLAQGQIESSFGTAGKARRTNGIWNVNGGRYSHPNHSVEPYTRLVRNKYLGQSKTIHNLMKNYRSLDGYRYAGHKHYERDLKRVYNDIKSNTAIHELYNKLIQTM